MNARSDAGLVLCAIGALLAASASLLGAADAPRRIAIVAGPKSHGPVGNGQHEHGANAKLVSALLRRSPLAGQLTTSVFLERWPEEQTPLEAADLLVIFCDGRDGFRGGKREALHLENPERVAFVERQMQRGCGLFVFHFATFAPDELADQVLRWQGGFFDWSADGGAKGWYSAIRTLVADVEPAAGEHPILRGVARFSVHEEFYFNMRFKPGDAGLAPILRVPTLTGARPGDGDVVAWARSREDGGRSFGTTMGHRYDNWKEPTFRRLMLNAIAWCARLDVPAGGIDVPYLDRAEVDAALDAPATTPGR